MELKDRNAIVTAVKKDGDFIDVEWTMEDGQRVEATFKLSGWQRAPRAVAKLVTEAFSGGLPIDYHHGRKKAL